MRYGNDQLGYVPTRIPVTAADLDPALVERIRELGAEGSSANQIRDRLAEEHCPLSTDVVEEVLKGRGR